MTIVVSGATGQLGRRVVEELLARGVAPADVVAGGRDEGRLAALGEATGVRTARMDYDDPATLEAALSAGDVFLLVSGSEPGGRVPQHAAAIDAAVHAGVAHVAYTSVLGAGDTPLSLAAEHEATEELLRASGLPVTLLRNGWYTENYAATLEQARATGVVLTSTGEGRVASATRDDYAAATARVLADVAAGDGAEHVGAAYELSGDHAWDAEELVAALGEVLGREVTLRAVDTDSHVAALRQAGLDEGTAGFVAGLDAAIAQGALAATPGDLSRLAGRPTTPLVDALRAMA